jgi:hypothetical protein
VPDHESFGLNIKLDFDNPSIVSSSSGGKDKLSLGFKRPELFVTEATGEPLLGENIGSDYCENPNDQSACMSVPPIIDESE